LEYLKDGLFRDGDGQLLSYVSPLESKLGNIRPNTSRQAFPQERAFRKVEIVLIVIAFSVVIRIFTVVTASRPSEPNYSKYFSQVGWENSSLI
jgi:hypothetical protein